MGVTTGLQAVLDELVGIMTAFATNVFIEKNALVHCIKLEVEKAAIGNTSANYYYARF